MALDYWRDRSVLVTGCRGFVGGALAQRLASLGANLVLPIRPGTPTPEYVGNLENIVVPEVSLFDAFEIEQLFGTHAIKTVFHMAANNENRDTEQSPLAIFEDNIRATYCVLEAGRRAGAKRVILASSREIDRQIRTGDAEKFHPYAASKASTDLIARAYVESYGFPVTVVKPDNIYGPGDLNFRRLIPSTIRELLQHGDAKFGGDPETERGFIYIDDLIDALLIIGCLPPEDKIANGIIDLRASERHRIGDVLDLLTRLTKDPTNAPDRNASPPGRPASGTQELTDWRAEVPLEEGLRRTIASYRAL